MIDEITSKILEALKAPTGGAEHEELAATVERSLGIPGSGQIFMDIWIKPPVGIAYPQLAEMIAREIHAAHKK